MGLSVKGSGSGDLQRLARRIQDAGGEIGRRMAQAGGREIKRLIAEEFASGTDPYGKKWPVPQDGHRPPMIRSRELMRGYHYATVKSPVGWRTQVTNDAAYSELLQRGTRRMTRRRHLPDQRQGLPARWQRAIEDAKQIDVQAYLEREVLR